MKAILLFLCVLSYIAVNAQKSDFLDGYIVTFSNDTLIGKVNDRKLGRRDELTNKIHVKLDNGRVKKIKKRNIAVYKRGNEIFIRKRIQEQLPLFKIKNDAEYFLVQLVSGPVALYKYYFNDFDNHTIDYVFLIKSKNSYTYKRLPLLGFKKILKPYFNESPGMIEMINEKRFRYADIPELVQALQR